jgi:hypothetical protein
MYYDVDSALQPRIDGRELPGSSENSQPQTPHSAKNCNHIVTWLARRIDQGSRLVGAFFMFFSCLCAIIGFT